MSFSLPNHKYLCDGMAAAHFHLHYFHTDYEGIRAHLVPNDQALSRSARCTIRHTSQGNLFFVSVKFFSG